MSDRARIGAFLEMMSAERGASPNTLDAYGRDLLDASEFCGGRLVHASQAELAAWTRDLAARGLSQSTQARKVSTLRRFCRFLFEEGDRRDNPSAALSAPIARRAAPDVLSRAEIDRLIAAAACDTRLACLVELLYAAGLRASELVSLKLGQLPRRKGGRWQSAEILVRGKGGADRLCPLGRPALAAIDAWLIERAALLGPDRTSDYLFPARSGAGHLTRRRLGQLLETLAHKAGLDPARVHPHAFRHAYATHLLQGGADLRSVQTLLGHADIATTQIYTHIPGDELAELVETAHPMSRRQRR